MSDTSMEPWYIPEEAEGVPLSSLSLPVSALTPEELDLLEEQIYFEQCLEKVILAHNESPQNVSTNLNNFNNEDILRHFTSSMARTHTPNDLAESSTVPLQEEHAVSNLNYFVESVSTCSKWSTHTASLQNQSMPVAMTSSSPDHAYRELPQDTYLRHALSDIINERTCQYFSESDDDSLYDDSDTYIPLFTSRLYNFRQQLNTQNTTNVELSTSEFSSSSVNCKELAIPGTSASAATYIISNNCSDDVALSISNDVNFSSKSVVRYHQESNSIAIITNPLSRPSLQQQPSVPMLCYVSRPVVSDSMWRLPVLMRNNLNSIRPSLDVILEQGFLPEPLQPEISLRELVREPHKPFEWDNVAKRNGTYTPLTMMNHCIQNFSQTDTIIHIGDTVFHCHFAVLANYSSYFLASLIRDRVFTFEEKHITPLAFKTIYSWMISGDSVPDVILRSNVLQVFMATQRLGVKVLEYQCWILMCSQLLFDERTAFDLYLEARHRYSVLVMDLMMPRISKCILEIFASEQFCKLPVDVLCSLLTSNYIAISCEMEIVLAAARWLQYDWEIRKQFLPMVMNCVRWGLISPSGLLNLKRHPGNAVLKKYFMNPIVSEMFDEGMAFSIVISWPEKSIEGQFACFTRLGLSQPEQRNWFGQPKEYITYANFLTHLKEARQGVIKKSLMKSSKPPKPSKPSKPTKPTKPTKPKTSKHRSRKNKACQTTFKEVVSKKPLKQSYAVPSSAANSQSEASVKNMYVLYQVVGGGKSYMLLVKVPRNEPSASANQTHHVATHTDLSDN